MPLYDYECRSCETVTEVRHGFDEPYTGTCPTCDLPLVRKFSAAPIVFKGSGFYVTDSRKSGEKGSSNGAGTKPSEKLAEKPSETSSSSASTSSSSEASSSSTSSKSEAAA